MLICELEKMALQYEADFSINQMLLEKTVPLALVTKWDLPNKNEFVIISPSSKKTHHQQLTFFRNNEPQYDLQRYNIDDLAHELTILEAKINTINYLK